MKVMRLWKYAKTSQIGCSRYLVPRSAGLWGGGLKEERSFWNQAPGFMGHKGLPAVCLEGQATPKGHCAPRQYPNRSLGLAASPLWGLPLSRLSAGLNFPEGTLFNWVYRDPDLSASGGLSHWDLCLMILNLSSTILTKVGIGELAMGCNGGVYPNLAKIEATRMNFDSWKDILPRPWHHLQAFLP